MLIALIFVFILIVLFIIYDRIKYRRLYKYMRKIPGPRVIPLIGVAYDFRSIYAFLETLLKYFHLYGPTSAVWIFRVPVVIVSEPKHLKIVMNSENCIDKDKRYQLTQSFFGEGLVVAPAHKWKRNRKLMNPTFSQKILDSFVHIFVKHADLMLKDMENIPENTLFDVDHFFMSYNTDILLETAMGINEEVPRPPRFIEAINRASQIVADRVVQVWLHPDFIYHLSPLGREFQIIFAKLMPYFNKVIEKSYIKFHNQNKEEVYFDDNKKKPFLEHLLTLGNNFTIKEMLDEVVVFITAGIDTTSTTIGYLFVCLGMNKDVQEKVYQELLDVFGENNRPICVEDLPKLRYLDQVIKETLRILPSVPIAARFANKDVDLGDYVIPQGATILTSYIVTHRNEKIWPNPLKFDPDRFLPSAVAEREPYAYVPFSGGPRNCIGKQFAMTIIKIVAASVLRNFKIDTNIKLEDMRHTLHIVLKLVGGANISIEKRHKHEI